MPDANSPNELPPSLSPDERARRRGRMGLAIPWESMPWWMIIVLIVAVIAGYSVLTNEYYQDALYFIFDLPWNRNVVKSLDVRQIEEDGTWAYTFTNPLDPGKYTFYTDYVGEGGEKLGRGETYVIEIPRGSEPAETAPLTPSDEPVVIDTSTPTITGVAPEGTTKVQFVDDFSTQPLRIAHRIWIANGVILTIKVTLISFVFAVILGLIFGIMRVSSGSPDLRINAWRRLGFGLGVFVVLMILRPAWRSPAAALAVFLIVESIFFLLPALPFTISTLYVEIVRGVPMLVIILYMGFAVTPAIREGSGGFIDLRGLPAAVIGLSFGYGAYLAEVFRAGIESIPHGQIEAARSIGMSYFQAMRFVILPQAVRMILPPLGNDFIAMLKDSSLISVIALPEVLQQGRLWISRNFRAFEGYNSVMMVYLVMTLLLSLMVRAIERRAELPKG